MQELTRSSFFASWRKRIKSQLPYVQQVIAQVGILGTVGASIIILAQDPALSTGVLTGLVGNFISNAVERWRNAPDDDERNELLQQIISEVSKNQVDQDAKAAMIDLNLAQLSIDSLGAKVDQLKGLIDAGFATQEQVLKINTGGGSYTGHDVNARQFVGRDIINITSIYAENKSNPQSKEDVSPQLWQDILLYVQNRAMHVAGKAINKTNLTTKIRQLDLDLLPDSHKEALKDASLEKVIALMVYSAWQLAHTHKKSQLDDDITLAKIITELENLGI